jgi:hypothetical protein
MDLYRGSLSPITPSGYLSHFGSMTAAVERIDSIYGIQYPKALTADIVFIRLDHNNEPLSIENSMEALESFASFMQTATVSRYSADIKNPLRLTDCWEDDPIGSGALQIFKGNNDLSENELVKLKELFSPFSQIIYSEHVQFMLSKNAVKDLKKRSEKDPLFKEEIEKRKQRLQAIGEKWAPAESRELVWVNLTLKLRNWALENKYDAFVYKNDCEGENEDSYITLKGRQGLKREEDFQFNKDMYLKTVSPIFDRYLNKIYKTGQTRVPGLHWAELEPTQFWSKKNDPKA